MKVGEMNLDLSTGCFTIIAHRGDIATMKEVARVQIANLGQPAVLVRMYPVAGPFVPGEIACFKGILDTGYAVLEFLEIADGLLCFRVIERVEGDSK